MGPRAGRALDRPAHGRGGLRAGRRRARAATTPSCSTSSATCSSRSTSCRCCSRSAAPASLAEVAEHVPPEADPPPPARLRRRRGRATPGEVLRNWDAIKQAEDGPRAGDLRRGAREPARAAVRAQGAAPRRVDGLRLRPRALRRRRGRARGAARRRRRARSASTRSATCCSRRSTSRASSRSTRSSRCAPRPTASAAASRPPRRSPQRDGARLGRARPRRAARATTRKRD